MDLIQDYLPYLHAALPSKIITPLLKTLTTTLAIFQTLSSHLQPFYNRLLTSPDATSIILLLIVLFLSFKILDMAYRAVMFWIRMAIRLVVWGSILGVGFWIWQRGMEGFVQDVEGLVRFWWGEWERFEGDVRMVKERKEEEIFRGQQGGRRGWR